jgi:iron-sulfur cluster assembly protein
MFTVTPQAAAKILASASASDAKGMALRLAAQITADGGIDFGMGFDEQRQEDMEIVCEGGVNVLIGPNSWGILKGATLDYVELEPGRFNFIFIPPQPGAPQAGGCGTGCGCSSGNSETGGACA